MYSSLSLEPACGPAVTKFALSVHLTRMQSNMHFDLLFRVTGGQNVRIKFWDNQASTSPNHCTQRLIVILHAQTVMTHYRTLIAHQKLYVTLTYFTQTWCNLQVKLCDLCLSALRCSIKLRYIKIDFLSLSFYSSKSPTDNTGLHNPWVPCKLTFIALTSRRAALSDNTSLIVTFSSLNFCV